MIHEMDPRLDISNDPYRTADDGTQGPRRTRPFLGINFQCCQTYGRIYRNQTATKYEGQCPKCRAKISVPIGDGGSGARFFNAS
jgi:hypothetical protein